jgi:hypothetical protein
MCLHLYDALFIHFHVWNQIKPDMHVQEIWHGTITLQVVKTNSAFINQ